MTLDKIRIGVENPIVEALTSFDSSRSFDFNSQKGAVLASSADYEDAFARLKVFRTDTRRFVPTQSFDSIIQNPFDLIIPNLANVEIDYLLLQGIAETFVERVAPMYSFGSSLLYTAGSDVKSFSYSALIIADKITGDNPTRFAKSYKNALRASELVDPTRPGYVELSYRDQVRRGFLTQLAVQKNSDRPNEVSVNFSMFVADYFNKKKT